MAGGGLVLAGGLTDTLIFRITATGRQGGSVSITANLSARDANLYSRVLTASKSATISVTAEEKLRIIRTKVEAYHMISDEAYINTLQPFNVYVVVENGLGQSIKNIRVRLSSNGQSVIADSAYRWISQLSPSKVDTLEYSIIASENTRLTGETFTATLTSARYQLSGLPVTVGPAIDSTANIIIQSPAELYLNLTSERPINHTYSTNQVFSVIASIENKGDAGIDDSGILRIYLPSQYQLISSADTVHLSPAKNAVWKVRTPSTPQFSRPISVDWYRRPRDVNTNEEAVVPGSEVSETIYVTTILSQLYTSLDVDAPMGAMDDTVSTDQIFSVRAIVSWNNARDIISTLNLPSGYTTTTKKEQSINWESPSRLDTLIWLVRAPAEASELDTISVITRGYDAIQTTVPIIEYSIIPIVITTVQKASLSLSMSITNPPDAMDGSLSLGQSFTIQAVVSNSGTADTLGVTLVSIDPLPNGYSTPDGILVKPLINGSVTWEIVAPLISSARAGKIEGKIIDVPLDENTNQDAFIIPNQGSFAIPVTTESYLLSVAQEPLNSWVDASLVPGQNKVKLMILSFDNRGRGNNHLIVDAIKFDIEDRFGESISPNSVISRVYVVNEEDTLEVYGSTIDVRSTNPVTIPFSRVLSIPVDGNPSLSIFADIANPVGARYFQLNIKNGSYISAKDAESKYPVSVKNTAEEDWTDMRSAIKYIYDPNIESNLWCSPNPFGQSEKPYTTIRYFLQENSNVDFYIYTLVGDLVWSYHIPQNDSRATPGPHAFIWEGKNDNEHKVLNGVYLLYMKTEKGIEGKFKIAVVK